MKIVIIQFRMIEQRISHRRHDSNVRYLFSLNQFENFRRVELRYDDMTSAHTGQGVRSAPAVDVKERNRMQLHMMIADANAADNLHGMKIEVAMRHHHTFRICRCTGSVEEFG